MNPAERDESLPRPREVEDRPGGLGPARQPRRGPASKIAGAFVLLSLAGALAPMGRHVARLSRDEFVLWAAAVVWVLALPVLFLSTLRLVRSWLARQR